MYESETRTLINKQEHTLNAFDRKLSVEICGPTKHESQAESQKMKKCIRRPDKMTKRCPNSQNPLGIQNGWVITT